MESILEVCGGLEIDVFQPGDYILEQGERTGSIFILLDGGVELVRDGKPVAETADPGTVFGEIAAVLGKRHVASVRALTKVRVYAVEDAENWLRANPHLNFHITRILARRMASVVRFLDEEKTKADDECVESLTGLESLIFSRHMSEIL